MASGPIRIRIRSRISAAGPDKKHWPKHWNIFYFFFFLIGYHIYDDSTSKYSTYRINLYVDASEGQDPEHWHAPWYLFILLLKKREKLE